MSSQIAVGKRDAIATIFGTRAGLPVLSFSIPQSRATVTNFTNVAFFTGTPNRIVITGPAGSFSGTPFSLFAGGQPLKIVLTGGTSVLQFPSGASAYSICYIPLTVTQVTESSITATISAPSGETNGAFLNSTGLILDVFTSGSPAGDQALYITLNLTTTNITLAINTALTLSSGSVPLPGALANIYKLTSGLSVGQTPSSPTSINIITKFVHLGLTNGSSVNSNQALSPGNLTMTATPSATIFYAGLGYTVGDQFVVSGSFFGGSGLPATSMTIRVLTVTTGGVIATISVTGSLGGDANNTPILLQLNRDKYRDASDNTRALKEQIIYNEKRVNSPINSGKSGSLVFGRPGVNPGAENSIPAGNAGIAWIPQGNQYRLSYLFGKLKCGGGFAGAFNLNGPIQKS